MDRTVILEEKEREEVISMNTWTLSLEVLSCVLVQEEHDGILSERERSESGEAEVVGICDAEHWKGERFLVKEIPKYG